MLVPEKHMLFPDIISSSQKQRKIKHNEVFICKRIRYFPHVCGDQKNGDKDKCIVGFIA